jgi:hypothetical protein
MRAVYIQRRLRQEIFTVIFFVFSVDSPRHIFSLSCDAKTAGQGVAASGSCHHWFLFQQ